MKKIFFIVVNFLLFSIHLYAENFRVKKVVPISLTDNFESIEATTGISDAIYITIPEDTTFISGIEINFKLPEEIASWRDSVAYAIYENLKQQPEEKRLDYSGERLFLKTLPGRLSLTVYIPISEEFSIKDNPYSEKLPKIQIPEKGIFMRFFLVMKGVPASLEKSQIGISAKPVLIDKGILDLSIEPEQTEEKKYSISIDDTPFEYAGITMLKSGEHHLSVVSDSYRNELRSFRIEQAKQTKLNLKLRGIEPTVKILGPNTAKIAIDDKEIQNSQEEIVIEQGNHVMKFQIGDYELIKTISAENGHSYIINLNIDASVSEEE